MPPQVHWARDVPNEMKDVVDIYLNDPRAEKYRVMDRAKNGGHDPEKTTTISDNVCFCLLQPTYASLTKRGNIVCSSIGNHASCYTPSRNTAEEQFLYAGTEYPYFCR